MKKAKVKEIFIKLSSMGKRELLAYHSEIYKSKELIPPKTFDIIERGFELRMANLSEITDLDPMIVLSELKFGEI